MTESSKIQRLRAHTDHQQHGRVDGQKTQPAPQIRLLEDQQQAGQHNQPRQNHPVQPPRARHPGVIVRQHQHQDQFGKFRRLEREGPDRNPPLGTTAGLTHDQHDRQHNQNHRISRIGQARNLVIVGQVHHQERDRAQQNPHELFEIKRKGGVLRMRDAVDRQHPDRQDDRDQPHETEVKTI